MRLPPIPAVLAQGPPAFETLAFKRLEDFLPARDLFVILCRESPPTDTDWDRYIEAVRASVAKQSNDLNGVMTLVLSDGGVPNAMQRTHLTGLHERSSAGTPLSLISDSPLIRGATRAMALFNPRFKVFAPGGFAKALDHLGVPPALATVVKSHILETEQLLGGPRIRVVRAIFARSGVE